MGDNTFPTIDGAGTSSWWTKRVVISASDRDTYAGELAYHVTPSALVAIVELDTNDSHQARFHVLESLAGEFPAAEIYDGWSNDGSPFPGASSTRYIATFSDVAYVEAAHQYGGSILDFRPETPEARAMVIGAIARAREPWDGAALLDFAKYYRMSWQFHRAPDVVATTVYGIAGECCTNAGGTFVAHDINTDLRGTAGVDFLIRGGHAYYSDEKCGDALILGTEDLGHTGTGEAPALECTDTGGSLDTSFPTDRVLVELPDSPANRARTVEWIGADEPNYLLHTEDESLAPKPAPSEARAAPWSAPSAVDHALVSAPLAWLRIVRAVAVPGGHEVTIDTTFSPYTFDHLPVHRMKLAFTCGDPRLLREGSEWLAPIVSDGFPSDSGAARAQGAFIVPGVLLPNLGWVLRTEATFGYGIRR